MGKRVNSTDKTKTRIFEIEEDIKKKKNRAGEIKKQMLSLKEKLSKLEQQISEQCFDLACIKLRDSCITLCYTWSLSFYKNADDPYIACGYILGLFSCCKRLY